MEMVNIYQSSSNYGSLGSKPDVTQRRITQRQIEENRNLSADNNSSIFCHHSITDVGKLPSEQQSSAVLREVLGSHIKRAEEHIAQLQEKLKHIPNEIEVLAPLAIIEDAKAALLLRQTAMQVLDNPFLCNFYSEAANNMEEAVKSATQAHQSTSPPKHAAQLMNAAAFFKEAARARQKAAEATASKNHWTAEHWVKTAFLFEEAAALRGYAAQGELHYPEVAQRYAQEAEKKMNEAMQAREQAGLLEANDKKSFKEVITQALSKKQIPIARKNELQIGTTDQNIQLINTSNELEDENTPLLQKNFSANNYQTNDDT